MAKIGLPKGSGKRLKVREKSVKSQGILKWILSGNPVYCLNNCDNAPCPQPKEAGPKIQVILIGVCMQISLDQRFGCVGQACISFNTPCNFRCQRFNRLCLEKT